MSGFSEEEYLQLSGIQHFAFCRRQWALIHLEQLWQENLRTVEGTLLHERAHNETLREKRGDQLTVRALRIFSQRLGISGSCDVVEFRAAPEGIALHGHSGRWLPLPVEYKRGTAKPGDEDRLQLCAQARCLEEMLVCRIPEGCLYYGQTRRRETIPFSDALRQSVEEMLSEMHAYARRGYTPRVKTGKHCNACSLKELCLPVLCRGKSARDYLREQLREG